MFSLWSSKGINLIRVDWLLINKKWNQCGWRQWLGFHLHHYLLVFAGRIDLKFKEIIWHVKTISSLEMRQDIAVMLQSIDRDVMIEFANTLLFWTFGRYVSAIIWWCEVNIFRIWVISILPYRLYYNNKLTHINNAI